MEMLEQSWAVETEGEAEDTSVLQWQRQEGKIVEGKKQGNGAE